MDCIYLLVLGMEVLPVWFSIIKKLEFLYLCEKRLFFFVFCENFNNFFLFKNDLYERIYHKSIQKSWNLSFSGTQIVENPELLSAIEKIEDNVEHTIICEPPKPVIQDIALKSPNLNSSILIPANKQLETRLPSGKRRITPMLLTSAPPGTTDTANLILTNLEVPSKDTNAFSSSSPTKSKIIVETVSEQARVSTFGKQTVANTL